MKRTDGAKTLSAQIHDSILEMVIDSGAASEELLLTESELVDRFGVSKAPVREALLRLCSEDVLKSIPRCGYVVVRLGKKSGKDNLIVRRMRGDAPWNGPDRACQKRVVAITSIEQSITSYSLRKAGSDIVVIPIDLQISGIFLNTFPSLLYPVSSVMMMTGSESRLL